MTNSVVPELELDYEFELFASSNMPSSEQALANLKEICETYLVGHYKLQVYNIEENLDIFIKKGALIAPTLKVTMIPKGKPPLKPVTFIGMLTPNERVLSALMIDVGGNLSS